MIDTDVCPSATLRHLHYGSNSCTLGAYTRLATNVLQLKALRVMFIHDDPDELLTAADACECGQLVQVGRVLGERSASFAAGLHTLQARLNDARLFVVMLTALPNLRTALFAGSDMYSFFSWFGTMQRSDARLVHDRLHALDLSDSNLGKPSNVPGDHGDDGYQGAPPNYWQALVLPSLRVLNLSFAPLHAEAFGHLAHFSRLVALGLRDCLPPNSTPYAPPELPALEYLDLYHSENAYTVRDVGRSCPRLSYYHPPLADWGASLGLDDTRLRTLDLDCGLAPPALPDGRTAPGMARGAAVFASARPHHCLVHTRCRVRVASSAARVRRCRGQHV